MRDHEPELRIKLIQAELQDAMSDDPKQHITCDISVYKDQVIYELCFGKKGPNQIYRAHYCSRADNKLFSEQDGV